MVRKCSIFFMFLISMHSHFDFLQARGRERATKINLKFYGTLASPLATASNIMPKTFHWQRSEIIRGGASTRRSRNPSKTHFTALKGTMTLDCQFSLSLFWKLFLLLIALIGGYKWLPWGVCFVIHFHIILDYEEEKDLFPALPWSIIMIHGKSYTWSTYHDAQRGMRQEVLQRYLWPS